MSKCYDFFLRVRVRASAFLNPSSTSFSVSIPKRTAFCNRSCLCLCVGHKSPSFKRSSIREVCCAVRELRGNRTFPSPPLALGRTTGIGSGYRILSCFCHFFEAQIASSTLHARWGFHIPLSRSMIEGIVGNNSSLLHITLCFLCCTVPTPSFTPIRISFRLIGCLMGLTPICTDRLSVLCHSSLLSSPVHNIW